MASIALFCTQELDRAEACIEFSFSCTEVLALHQSPLLPQVTVVLSPAKPSQSGWAATKSSTVKTC